MKTELKLKWLDLFESISSSDELGDKLWNDITEKYTQKSRAYHNLTHIHCMLDELEKFKHEIDDLEVLQFSIWYHDIIYHSMRKDNEEKSAEYAQRKLKTIPWDASKISKCYFQIMLTKHHLLKPHSERDEQFLLDFDLEVLSRDWDAYKTYCEQIRTEYWMYPTVLYRKGRRDALLKFLKREHIYFTPHYQKNKEAKARENIQREIDELL